MGQEAVFYKDRSFEANNHVISRLQKFMELQFRSINHPDWFDEVIQDLKGNFHIPHGKYFFDEDIIEVSEDRLKYALKMLDMLIEKSKSINYFQFKEIIQEEISGSWCDFPNIKLTKDEAQVLFKENYIGTLTKLRTLITDQSE